MWTVQRFHRHHRDHLVPATLVVFCIHIQCHIRLMVHISIHSTVMDIHTVITSVIRTPSSIYIITIIMRQPARRTRRRKSKILTHKDCGDDDSISSSQEISIFYVELKIYTLWVCKSFWNREEILESRGYSVPKKITSVSRRKKV